MMPQDYFSQRPLADYHPVMCTPCTSPGVHNGWRLSQGGRTCKSICSCTCVTVHHICRMAARIIDQLRRIAPDLVCGSLASSTAMMVGSSLYTTPVIVFLRVRIVVI